jgi:putative membrane protein
MLSATDQSRIEAAVTQAESGTSGEIICVLSGEVSHYPEVALGWAAVASLILPALAVVMGVHPLAVAGGLSGAWSAGQTGTVGGQISLSLAYYAAFQTALFLLVFLIMEIPPVRRALTPALLKRHRVERAARQQFAAIAARAAGSETGVLLFVALVDRQVQILADKSLHEKADDAAWNAAALAITRAMKKGADPTGGIVQAVEICGSVLRAHFPSTDGGGHVFSARPVEI